VEGIFPAWGRILLGYRPNLSIELTRECPLRCPGCYAYSPDHLGGGITLRQVRDLKGDALVRGVHQLIDRHRPIHVSLIGGEPLVRFRELETLLPQLSARGLHVQLVTSAVRPIPGGWARIPRLQIVVSIDGLAPEHDARRAPATYERILKHIAGHQVTVHCTVTRQQVQRDGYLEEFLAFWSANRDTRQIWMSLYTPQVGEQSAECLTADDRRRVIGELMRLRVQYPALKMPKGMVEALASPPASPGHCTFARTTECVSADLEHPITPCQLGGMPDCARCGCIASAGLHAVWRHRLPGGIRVGAIYDASLRFGNAVRRVREAVTARPVARARGSRRVGGRLSGPEIRSGRISLSATGSGYEDGRF
jgi:organic radical activating enzyme